MFEQDLEQMSATIWLEQREAALLDSCGVAILSPGSHRVSYSEAAELVEKMKRLAVNVPKYQQARYRATMNSIRTAFGPEFWERH